MIAAVVVATALLVAGCGGSLDTHDPAPPQTSAAQHGGGDAHTELPDPLDAVTNDPATAAEAALQAMFSWRPDTDASPGAAVTRALPYLGGALADAARSTPPALLLPPEWASWARSKDVVSASAAARPTDSGSSTTDNAATRVVDLRQSVLHANGQSTPLSNLVVVAELVRTQSRWTLISYRVIAAS